MSKRAAMMAAVRQQIAVVVGGAYTPVGDTGVVAIYDATVPANIVSNAGTDVDQFQDSSGNGRHASAGSAANKMQHDSANGWVKNTAVTGRSGFSTPSMATGRMYIVMRCGDGTDTSWGATQYLLTGNYGIYGKMRISASSAMLYTGSAGTNYAETSKKNGSTTSTQYQLPMPMSLLVLSVAAAYKPVTQVHSIGYYHEGDGQSFTHPIKLIMFTDGLEDDALRWKREGWCAHKCGTQGSLVEGHLYKVTPP